MVVLRGLVLGIAFLSLLSCSTLQVPSYEGPITDHFDGDRFYNLYPAPEKGFGDVLAWMLKRQKPKWPEWVEYPKIPVAHSLEPNQIRVTFINHSTISIRSAGFHLLTDPVYSRRVGPFSWIGPKRHHAPGIDWDQLPKVDAIVVSHNHYDHLDVPTLQKLSTRDDPTMIVPLANAAFLSENKVNGAIDLDWWQSHELKQSSARVTAVPAQHWSLRAFGNRRKALWAGFVIEILGRKIFFAGDTGYSPHFKLIREKMGAMDLCLLPIGAYLPRDFMKDNHTSPEDSVHAFQDLECKKAIPIHFGTFLNSDEQWGQPEADLQKALAEFGIPAERFPVLKPGEYIDI